jgi:hypothetical protein
MDTEKIKKEIAHNHNLITNHTKRLHALEYKQAMLGLEAGVSIKNRN